VGLRVAAGRLAAAGFRVVAGLRVVAAGFLAAGFLAAAGAAVVAVTAVGAVAVVDGVTDAGFRAVAGLRVVAGFRVVAALRVVAGFRVVAAFARVRLVARALRTVAAADPTSRATSPTASTAASAASRARSPIRARRPATDASASASWRRRFDSVDRAASSCFWSFRASRAAFLVNGATAWPAPATRSVIAAAMAFGPVEVLVFRDPFVAFAMGALPLLCDVCRHGHGPYHLDVNSTGTSCRSSSSGWLDSWGDRARPRLSRHGR
jgi:hypothetical protein